MNPTNLFPKGPLVWVLAAGVLIGAGTASTVIGQRNQSSTYKSPYVTVEQPKLVRNTTSENRDMVRELDESFANLADAVKPAVVHIRVKGKQTTNMFGQSQEVGGEGSGFVFRPDGYIITNDHVVGGFEDVNVILYDGREFPGKVIRAEDSDIAVVKIDAKDLPTLRMANSNMVRTGEFAMAIGAPFGLDNTVTVGHISATQRTNQIPDPSSGVRRMYWDLIQTDAPINMGNSGGPLVNIDGEVVGINTAIFSPTGTSGGIGFAISSNQAKLLAETLIEKGKVTRGYLGVAPENLKIYQQKELGVEKGALVEEAPNNGPAAMAGIKKGDVIVRINSVPVESQVDLRNAMIKYGPGSKVEVEVVRDKEHKTFNVTAKEPPAPVVQVPRTNKSNPFGDLDIPKEFQLPEDVPGFKDLPRVNTPDGTPRNSEGGVKLGVSVEDVSTTARSQYNIPSDKSGAVVTMVAPKSPAAEAGIKQGDVIVGLGATKIESARDLANAMKSMKAGDSASIHFYRYSENSSMEQKIDVRF